MKLLLNRSFPLLVLTAILSFAGIARAQNEVDPSQREGAENLKKLFDELSKSDWENEPDADEIRALLKRVEEGKPLSPDQFAKLFEKIQMVMPDKGNSEHAKNHHQVRHAFRSIVAKANHGTVAVQKNGKQVALGTVVDDQGHVLTKASELKSKGKFSDVLACQSAGGKPRKATIVGVSEEYDLALLKTDAAGLAPVEWHKSGSPLVGSWLATTGLSDDPIAIGVVSVSPRKIGDGGGFLGVMLDQADEGPLVQKIVPKSAAAKAGMKEGDIVTKIDGKAVKTREEMVETVRQFKPGEVIKLTILRDGEKSELSVKLGGREEIGIPADRLQAMNRMGGPISLRRTNFPNVLQHDTVLRPEQCGGPVVDLDGHVVGINIARAGRVESYAVPAETIVALLPSLTSGELAPTPEQIVGNDKKPAEDEKPELEAVLEEIRKAEAELRNSQEKLRKAREALEKAGEKK